MPNTEAARCAATGGQIFHGRVKSLALREIQSPKNRVTKPRVQSDCFHPVTMQRSEALRAPSSPKMVMPLAPPPTVTTIHMQRLVDPSRGVGSQEIAISRLLRSGHAQRCESARSSVRACRSWARSRPRGRARRMGDPPGCEVEGCASAARATRVRGLQEAEEHLLPACAPRTGRCRSAGWRGDSGSGGSSSAARVLREELGHKRHGRRGGARTCLRPTAPLLLTTSASTTSAAWFSWAGS